MDKTIKKPKRRTIHRCSKEDKIDNIDKRLSKFELIIDGGPGMTGMKETMIRLDDSVNGLKEIMSKLSTSIQGFTIFQAETVGKISEAQRNKTNNRWLIALIISVALGIAGILAKRDYHKQDTNPKQTYEQQKTSSK